MTEAPHILIVDDDEQVVRYMQAALAENGYNVTVTTSGQRALEMIEDCRPDLLILADSRRGLHEYPPLTFKMNRTELRALADLLK